MVTLEDERRWVEWTKEERLEEFPFLDEITARGSKYRAEGPNSMRKVQAYHEDRDHYDNVIETHPDQKLVHYHNPQNRVVPKKRKPQRSRKGLST